jgi:hypothetical protein
VDAKIPEVRRTPLRDYWERLTLIGVLLVTFALRAFHCDQPIVENYVGRQIPTAMVARNLERGSGFFRPQLDTAPFPNYFLVEPPVYEWTAVALRHATGVALDPAGRLVSALAMVLGAWGLFGLVRRREGAVAAFVAVAAFGFFPLTIRYGRAFQPDALMLGTLLAGLRSWDEHEARGGRFWLATGWTLLALAFCLKVIAAYVLVPLIAVIVPARRWRKSAVAASALLPAACWYAYAWSILNAGTGSNASADNGAIWLNALIPAALFHAETWKNVLRFAVIRGFTPVGFVLAAWGLFLSKPPCEGRVREDDRATPEHRSRQGQRPAVTKPDDKELIGASRFSLLHQGGGPALRAPGRRGGEKLRGLILSGPTLMPGLPRASHPGACRSADRLWGVWAASAGLALALLAAKLHHEYYWLAIAPVVAVGVARALVRLAARRGKGPAIAFGCALTIISLVQSASTWRTPEDWSSLTTAADAVRAEVPRDAWVVAPEALLYMSDRRGCRLEWSERSMTRAAREWGERLASREPLALVELYRVRGARFFADVGAGGDPARLALHDAVRRRYNVLVDRPGVLLAALADPEDAPNGRR